MSTIPQLPKEGFDSLHPTAQIYIQHLEETIRKQEVRIHQLEERVRELESRLIPYLDTPNEGGGI